MTRTATIVDTYRLAPEVKGFRLRVPGEELAFDPGQHTTVRFDADGKEVVRPYSPTTLPGTDEIEIGEFEGNLSLEEPDRDIALLASGTGLTPLLSILRQYARDGSGDAHLVFGERTADSIFHRSTLNELAATYDSVTVTYTLSDPGWDWLDRAGYVQEHVEDLFDGFEERDCYVCGVPAMVVETTERLRELGAPDERIHSEGWESDAAADERD
ncbi:ferredoxin--NADP reductase [Natrinema marinum]|uniref:ferredoxin--NADP reductase n=1 Tax=Natrinema marinum TaxID=2961598 RepID=UPI0020C89084|nr:FAD-binding oxidoreductase [Natrinema marinum]